ncbi:MAG: metallophosphoesterase family protein [Oscillochloris sp.]|nr:metallophosphoesterase family protein [Oscillochloris sp.]
MQIGVIADTHGHLATGALEALHGVELILHAGDIGAEAIIARLEQVAPVLAVHGNTDAGTVLARQHPAMRRIEHEGLRIHLTHIGGSPAQIARSLPHEPELRPHVYIFGHSHIALLERHADVLFLNPGAAGQPRFSGGLSVALLRVAAGHAEAEIIALPTRSSGAHNAGT